MNVMEFGSSGTGSKKPKLIPYFDSPSAKAISFLAHQGSLAILRRYSSVHVVTCDCLLIA